MTPKIKLIIVSHKRPETMSSLRWVPKAEVCIPESQLDDYKKFHPNAKFITHPDSVVGLSPKRQWIYEKFGNVFFIDDDMLGVLRTYLPRNASRSYLMEPKEIYGWIMDLAGICIDKKIKLFGFNRTPHPLSYKGTQPIVHNRYITGGAFGILEDPNLYFPNIPDFVGEDYWISALNAYFNRMSFIDMRIAFMFNKTEGNNGGVADYRTEQKRKETYAFLRKNFGDAIQPKKDTYIKKRMSAWEKTLKIPY